MVGLNKFDSKKKREMRRRNHIARDLRTPKYKQRVEKKKDKDDNWNEDARSWRTWRSWEDN